MKNKYELNLKNNPFWGNIVKICQVHSWLHFRMRNRTVRVKIYHGFYSYKNMLFRYLHLPIEFKLFHRRLYNVLRCLTQIFRTYPKF